MTDTQTPDAGVRTASILGNTVLRREDPELLDGSAGYVADIAADQVLQLHFVRSSSAHALLESVHVDEARVLPGVEGVYVAADLDLAPFQSWAPTGQQWARPPIASDRVRFVGDIIAVVVATSAAQAADAADMVWCDFSPLPVVLEGAGALKASSPQLFPDNGSNVCMKVELNPTKDPMADAEHITELTMISQRLAGVPMETNSVLVVPASDETLTVYAATQNPLVVRTELGRALGLDPAKLRVVAPHVGGGFGPKSHAYPEFIVATAVAMRLGRPVRWIETRSENMVAMTHGRDVRLAGRLGMTLDGRITGLDVEATTNAGAYPALGGYLVKLTQLMSQGVYAIPQLRFQGRSTATNTTPTGPYRGAGRPEATQFLERIVDIACDELGLDPAEVRRLNLLSPTSFPTTTHTGATYDSGEYRAALDTALEAAGYMQLRADQTRRRIDGGPVQLGIGVACYVEVTAPDGTHVEFGSVELRPDGMFYALAGTSAHGQGHETSFAMVVADALGVSMEQVVVVHSDSAVIPRGSGTFGSRSLQTAGAALHVSSERVLASAKLIAAHLLEASIDDLEVSSIGIGVTGVPSSVLSWQELWELSSNHERCPTGEDVSLHAEVDFDAGGATFPFGCHVAVVEVDTETGEVRLIRHVAVDDCGRIVNPMIVQGQQHGGIAQGAAQALYEAIIYDEDGNPKSANLMDYAIPSAAELPFFEVHSTTTPTDRNPLGAKGIGESGTIGSTPAIHNAVIDAISHLGVRHVDMPLTPMRVFDAISAARNCAYSQGSRLQKGPDDDTEQ